MARRLNFLFLVACVILSSGCGCSVGNVHYNPSLDGANPSIKYDDDYARVMSSTPGSTRLTQIVERSIEPAYGLLPDLSQLDSLGRITTAIHQYSLVGSATYATGGNTLVLGDSLSLISPAVPGFAVYELSGIGLTHELKKLTVNTSSGSFTGDNPGYWVGISNFAQGRWDTLGLAQETEYIRSFAGTSDYTSLSGAIYVFVLVTGQQQVFVDGVSLEVDDAVWMEVEVDPGPDAGWTPAVAFLNNGNPIVAYSNYLTTNPMWAAGDRSTDLSSPGNWGIGTIAYPPDPAVGHWLDLTVDPEGNPVVSIIFSDTGTGTENSQLGYGVYADKDGTWAWDVLLLPFKDGLEYSAISRNPVTDVYAITHTAANLGSTAADYELFIELLDIGDPNIYTDDVLNIVSGFPGRYPGVAFHYPHLDFRPDNGYVAVCADGGYVYYGEIGDADGWIELYTEAGAGMVGSVAFNPVDNQLAQSFAENSVDTGTLEFVDYNSSLVGFRETVETMHIIGDEQIGEFSQVAYAPDGTPGIAYTRRDVSSTDIMYAYYDGVWNIEQVNSTSLFPGAGEQVVVDLAYDDSGVAAVCWNQLNGGACSLYVALRGL